MVRVKRVILDVLKPHQPNGLDFARTLAEQGGRYCVKLNVEEVDEKTESVTITIEGEDIDFDSLVAAINAMGASLHSIDAVEVEGDIGADD
jgi:hypothetical protein